MGLQSDHFRATYARHEIEVEGRAKLFSGQYSLTIDNERCDQIEGMFGTFTLRGKVMGEDGTLKPVIVWIKQGPFRTRYTLEIEKQEIPLTRA